jgi:formylglycine-generating enzyme required for sulfatase activity
MTTEPFHFGKVIAPKVANFADSKINGTTKVGSYPVNGFGLCDMHGNVWEWCADWYGRYATSESDNTDPQGASSSPGLVVRGGSWGNANPRCRAAYRDRQARFFPSVDLGFRVCRVPSGA